MGSINYNSSIGDLSEDATEAHPTENIAISNFKLNITKRPLATLVAESTAIDRSKSSLNRKHEHSSGRLFTLHFLP